MNLNITEDTPPDRARGVILHEFGHVLGAIHEHQSPLAQIPWDRDAVYAHYAELGRDAEWVNVNIFNVPFPESEIDADNDHHSVMVYPYPASFTTNATWVDWASELSTRDYQRVASIYPRNQYAVSSVTTNQPLEEPMEWQSISTSSHSALAIPGPYFSAILIVQCPQQRCLSAEFPLADPAMCSTVALTCTNFKMYSAGHLTPTACAAPVRRGSFSD